jgi:cytidine deaminase
VVTGANVENASYGLSLCAEAVAVAAAMNDGRRGGLLAVAVVGLAAGEGAVMPCGRCRQMLSELAQLGGTDPEVWSGEGEMAVTTRLSRLLPDAFGPDSLR